MKAAAPAIVDRDYLDDLRATIGDDPVDRMVQSFLAELETAPAVIADHAATGTLVEIRAAAHRLRGAALNLGCSGLARVCADIERAPPDAATDWMPQLRSAAADTRSILAAA